MLFSQDPAEPAGDGPNQHVLGTANYLARAWSEWLRTENERSKRAGEDLSLHVELPPAFLEGRSPGDYTAAFPSRHTCLLVGGTLAGPAGIASAALAVLAAGAARVDVAIVGGWTEPVHGVTHIREIGAAHMQVA
jgi:hypothetical protein